MKQQTSSVDTDQDELRVVARETLDAFTAISDAARAELSRPGVGLHSLAMVNQATAEDTARRMRGIEDERLESCQHLRNEPAIARLVIADEEDRQETIYVTATGTVAQKAVKLCSYMSEKGRLADLNVGGARTIKLPDGPRYYEVIDKITFKPIELAGFWDAQPAVHFREDSPALTIKSLLELLRLDGVPTEQIDELAAWLESDDPSDGNLIEGIMRDALTAMELRVVPLLDEFQGRIFRLPISAQIAVLGPPGTGKTTTLVIRLRQKIDFAYLDPEDERPLVEDRDAAGFTHADSWLMFTPTELLRLYVKDAFAKKGVPAPDMRVRTWTDYRREICRGPLRILKTGISGGLVLREDDTLLRLETLENQIAWFEAFDAHQGQVFVDGLQVEAQRLSDAVDARAAALGRQIIESLARSGSNPVQLLGELLIQGPRLREVAEARRDETGIALREPLRLMARLQDGFLEALTVFVETLGDDRTDVAEDEDLEGDDDDAADQPVSLRGRKLAADVFTKAMRSRALAQASGRSPSSASRAGRVAEWIKGRGLDLPDLKQVGASLLVQRAALRLSRAANDYVARVPLRYRRFRHDMRQQGKYYSDHRAGALDVHPAEVDLILLAMLRTARAMEGDRVLTQRFAGRQPPVLAEIARLRRHQVLVDEATDFSPIQLASMRALAHPRTESFFLSGDFNQRLTRWGSRSEADLRWVSPAIQIEHIDISYRQSRKLADFARALGRLGGYVVDDREPEHSTNVGFEPVIGRSLPSPVDQAQWLSARIREIDRLTDGVLPTIAVLMPSGDLLDQLADALSLALLDLNIKAEACTNGKFTGQPGDVRIFEVEHVKGLEFEAVFFLDIDELKNQEPSLFDRYIYVGATRAATFLGLTCRGPALPEELSALEATFLMKW